ncbi:hypothetical protein Q8A67_024935 [Cirrhinus molitorella]|uniref:DRBM domain-containing protein n=1 Tax=Cirrhinus molitorella TaxID=172907 RepID=A0AA88T989_9TELE|nr:hypothetical protein Q8A67_024935 [Cirrhinus molitorella]
MNPDMDEVMKMAVADKFIVKARVGDETFDEGIGMTKRAAREAAAQLALVELQRGEQIHSQSQGGGVSGSLRIYQKRLKPRWLLLSSREEQNRFIVKARVGEETFAEGVGMTKKAARERAAQLALAELQRRGEQLVLFLTDSHLSPPFSFSLSDSQSESGRRCFWKPQDLPKKAEAQVALTELQRRAEQERKKNRTTIRENTSSDELKFLWTIIIFIVKARVGEETFAEGVGMTKKAAREAAGSSRDSKEGRTGLLAE